MAKVDFSPIADTTRRAEIVALLRRAILTGQLEPGQKLNELRISEQMRVSRAPLREAMRELVQEGILTSIPYAGTFVVDVTAKDIDDAYSLNKVLDEFAIERTWPLRDQRFFDELDQRHEAVKQATRNRDTTRQIETALMIGTLGLGVALVLVAIVRTQRLIRKEDAFHDALRASQQRYDYAISGTNDGIFDWRLAHRDLYLSWNFRARRARVLRWVVVGGREPRSGSAGAASRQHRPSASGRCELGAGSRRDRRAGVPHGGPADVFFEGERAVAGRRNEEGRGTVVPRPSRWTRLTFSRR